MGLLSHRNAMGSKKLVQSTLDSFFSAAAKKPRVEQSTMQTETEVTVLSSDSEMEMEDEEYHRSPTPIQFDVSDPSKCKLHSLI